MRNLLTDSFELSKGERAPGNVDIELGLQGDMTSSAQPGFEGFFQQVREIEKLLDTLAKLLKDLQVSFQAQLNMCRLEQISSRKQKFCRKTRENGQSRGSLVISHSNLPLPK